MVTPTETKTQIIPAMALRGLVLFPKTSLTFDVGRKKSALALNAAMDQDQLIFLVTQKDITEEDVGPEGIYEIGCVARIRQILKITDSVPKVFVEGLYRARRLTCTEKNGFMVCAVEPCPDTPVRNREVYKEALVRKIKSEFDRYIEAAGSISTEVVMAASKIFDVGQLADFIAYNIPAPYDDKQYLLEQLSPVKRGKILLELMDKEREIIQIDNNIHRKTRFAMDETQREYYLREQMRIISNELYGDDSAEEIDRYYDAVQGLNASDSVKETLYSEINKLSKMPSGSHEGTVIRDYLDQCLKLPWDTYTASEIQIKKAERILNRDFYGMDKVKERILEMLSVLSLSPGLTGQIVCLAGPPGVGKTSIGKTIAECMGRQFARISLGGVHDEAEIRGHRKTYIGAMPGRIIKAIEKAGSSNPLILLDEIDKLGSDYKGDPASALLEVLDPEQNSTFTDHFLEIPYDLSRVLFITTANDVSQIPAPLFDRMEIIELSGYTREEKLNIAKKHLVPKQMKVHGLSPSSFHITAGALYALIDSYTRESGVRSLERRIAAVCRKAALKLASGETEKVSVGENEIGKMLGRKKYRPEAILSRNEVGVVNGLAWTSVGGEIMQLEVAALEGSGKIELTGSLGDVMKESARAAVSFVRANAAQFGIAEDFYKKKDIHIHATEAAVPKDGPSAGVTITTGLISALTGRPVLNDVAMTGEVTILGRVLPIGGLKEKSMAAFRGGVKKVFIPKDNLSDLDEIDEKVLDGIRFVPVSKVGEIVKEAIDWGAGPEQPFVPRGGDFKGGDVIRQ